MSLLPDNFFGGQRVVGYEGPADGDYVRYVERLMAEAAAQQAQALRAAAPAPTARPARAAPEAAGWGRAPAKAPAPSVAAAQSTARERSQRARSAARAQALLEGLHQPKDPARAPASKGAFAAAPPWWWLVFAVVVVGLFASQMAYLLPVAFIAWVALNLVRQTRAAARRSD